MGKQFDPFRDFGIDPENVAPPEQTVRARFPLPQLIGQFAGTLFMAALGVGGAVVCVLHIEGPMSIPAAIGALGFFGYLIYLGIRNDYAWVELEGTTIRAQHLYTRKVVERSIDEVAGLHTILFPPTAGAALVVTVVGRIRGIMIRFSDKRTPLQVCRADPAMANAKELIEAVVFRMSERGPVETDVEDCRGKPLIRRIYWKRDDQAGVGVKRPK